MKNFDLVVIGGGPGGYVAAIRAAQLNKKVAVIEKDILGGVCLNRGCIPTKALIKSAHAVHDLKDFKSLGIEVDLKSLDGGVALKRSQQISSRIAKGVGLLMKKNNIEVIYGSGELIDQRTVVVTNLDGSKEDIVGEKIIIATGASYKSFPGLVHDGDRLIGAWEALKMEKLPNSIGIIGAGAIGVEFAYFWNAFGVNVHIFELMDHLLPIEEEDASIEVERAYRRYNIKTSLGVSSVSAKNCGEHATVTYNQKGEEHSLDFDMVLIAVGMTGNINGIGLESVGVKTERGFIVTNEMMETNVAGIYAIGDVSGPPLLAHVASHEGVIAAEHMSGLKPHPIDQSTIPACTYCVPQVASVGLKERDLKAQGIEYKVGKLPFMANGKAVASNEKSGFVKVLLDNSGKLLGAHIVNENATELIHEYTLLKSLGGTDEQLISTIHPHPTLGEWLAEAMMDANHRALNF